MRRILVDACLVILFFVLQCTLFRALSLGNVAPNLLIILTASYGFMRGSNAGLLTGFFCGLIVDIFSGDIIGVYTLIYMWIGYLNGAFHAIFYDVDVKLPMILITGSDLLFGLLVYVLRFLLRNKMNFPYYFLHIIVPEVIYTVVITIVLYRIILWINRKLPASKKGSEA